MKLLGAKRELYRAMFERAGALETWELLISDVDDAVQNERRRVRFMKYFHLID